MIVIVEMSILLFVCFRLSGAYYVRDSLYKHRILATLHMQKFTKVYNICFSKTLTFPALTVGIQGTAIWLNI